jgi:hypothetical protein
MQIGLQANPGQQMMLIYFTITWYEPGYANAVIHALDENFRIKIFQPLYFLASKIEAFKNRGGGDGRWSSDFEDIVYVLNNRTAVWKEIRESDNRVKSYLKEQFRTFLEGVLLMNGFQPILNITNKREYA